jgi:hypothetical protein
MDSYEDKIDAMQDRIDAEIKAPFGKTDKEKFVVALKQEIFDDIVIYSAYDTDDFNNDLPIDNLNEIPHKGTFVVTYTMHWGDKNYESKPITDPTWLQLAVLANEAIHVTGDKHHVFFENVTKEGSTLELGFGS